MLPHWQNLFVIAILSSVLSDCVIVREGVVGMCVYSYPLAIAYLNKINK